LQGELSAALQFGKLDLEHAAQITAYDVPPNITALDARLRQGLTDMELDDLEYQFKVVYTFDSASRGKAHVQFVSPDSDEGKTIHNVLQKFKIADDLYPYHPKDVVKLVQKGDRQSVLPHRSCARVEAAQGAAPERSQEPRQD
jgi:hypothetical protein